jgi:hypothetical protein
MNALIQLPNMLEETGRFGAANTSSALTNFAPDKEARMAEIRPSFILFRRQGQLQFCEVPH